MQFDARTAAFQDKSWTAAAHMSVLNADHTANPNSFAEQKAMYTCCLPVVDEASNVAPPGGVNAHLEAAAARRELHAHHLQKYKMQQS